MTRQVSRAATLAAFALLALASVRANATTTTTVVDIPVRVGVTVRILHIRPDAPIANIIFMPGGGGTAGIADDGTFSELPGICGPVSRARDLLAALGFGIAVVDQASDVVVRRYTDILEVERYLRGRDDVPIWIIGGGSSSRSVVDFAGQLPLSEPLGLIVFSPIFTSYPVEPLDPAKAALVKRPALVIFNTLDTGPVDTGPVVPDWLFAALTSASAKELIALTGGPPGSGACSAHTFYGMEDEFVAAITGFIKKFGPAVSAVLPSSRSVQVGQTATAFATIINAGSQDATDCRIAPSNSVPANFVYQITNPATNALAGAANTPVNIAAHGGSQSFVIGLTPTAVIAPTVVSFEYVCSNAIQAAVVTGLNTLLLVADNTPVPDIVALSATQNGDGIVHATPAGVFAVAVSNVGASGTIDVSTDTGSKVLPLVVAICQTDPSTSNCINPLDPTTGSVTVSIDGGATPTFGVFVARPDTATFPFDPANSRIFVRFRDNAGGTDRGATSVAVKDAP